MNNLITVCMFISILSIPATMLMAEANLKEEVFWQCVHKIFENDEDDTCLGIFFHRGPKRLSSDLDTLPSIIKTKPTTATTRPPTPASSPTSKPPVPLPVMGLPTFPRSADVQDDSRDESYIDATSNSVSTRANDSTRLDASGGLSASGFSALLTSTPSLRTENPSTLSTPHYLPLSAHDSQMGACLTYLQTPHHQLLTAIKEGRSVEARRLMECNQANPEETSPISKLTALRAAIVAQDPATLDYLLRNRNIRPTEDDVLYAKGKSLLFESNKREAEHAYNTNGKSDLLINDPKLTMDEKLNHKSLERAVRRADAIITILTAYASGQITSETQQNFETARNPSTPEECEITPLRRFNRVDRTKPQAEAACPDKK